MGYTMGYICQKLWDLFDKKGMGILGKAMGCIMVYNRQYF